MQQERTPPFDEPEDEGLANALPEPPAEPGAGEDRSRPDFSARAADYDEEDHERVDPAEKNAIEPVDLRDLTRPEPDEDYLNPDTP